MANGRTQFEDQQFTQRAAWACGTVMVGMACITAVVISIWGTCDGKASEAEARACNRSLNACFKKLPNPE